ncbi:MAG: protease modulator HflK, partial [Limnobacter sp.]|nr:protease modulator HflK [Limnobacter sp.]
RGNAARLLEEANGYKERVVAQASGDVARFESILNEYSQAPKVTRERLYLEAMQQVYTNVSKVLVDSKENSQLLYLPLDKLVGQPNAAAAMTSQEQAKAERDRNDSMNPLNSPMAQRRNSDREFQDSLRSRDR